MSILESLLADAYIVLETDGDGFDYEGDSKMCWDSQEPVEKGGSCTVTCENSHQWQTVITPSRATAADLIDAADRAGTAATIGRTAAAFGPIKPTDTL